MTKRIFNAFIAATITAGVLIFVGIVGFFMMIPPVIYFFSLTIKLLGISDGGSFFYVIAFWSILAFFVSLLLSPKRNKA
jgi:predicted membrane protein